MNQTIQSQKYEYRDDGCCMYPCPALECPEIICYLDYPGYKKTMDKFKQVLLMHKSGAEIELICQQVGLKRKQVQSFLTLIDNLVTI